MKKSIIAFMFCLSTSVLASPVNKMVVFGDSLSDNGNLYEYMKHQLPLSPPYYKGRFTNGPVWVELLVDYYYPNNPDEHLLDYAFGGAGVMEGDDIEDDLFTLHREMDTYFLAHQDKADKNSLYLVWIGSNNYLAVPDDPHKAIADVNTGLQHGIQRLIDSGAKHIMVVNVPDLGRTPAAKDFDAVDELSYLAKQHNIVLEKYYFEVKQRYPDIQWIYLDIFNALNDMMEKPDDGGFTNITNTCYEEVARLRERNSLLKMVSTVNPKGRADACDGFLFFDPVHPSAQAHRVMAERTIQLFKEEGIEFE